MRCDQFIHKPRETIMKVIGRKAEIKEQCRVKKVLFTNPNGREIEIEDIHFLKLDLIDNFIDYWMQGSGDGYFDFYLNGKRISSLPQLQYIRI